MTKKEWFIRTVKLASINQASYLRGTREYEDERQIDGHSTLDVMCLAAKAYNHLPASSTSEDAANVFIRAYLENKVKVPSWLKRSDYPIEIADRQALFLHVLEAVALVHMNHLSITDKKHDMIHRWSTNPAVNLHFDAKGSLHRLPAVGDFAQHCFEYIDVRVFGRHPEGRLWWHI